jgi:hypothetical protein
MHRRDKLFSETTQQKHTTRLVTELSTFASNMAMSHTKKWNGKYGQG